jgi:hypothetical protein
MYKRSLKGAIIMNENRTIHLIDIPIGGEAGLSWNRLHEEREQICEALVKDHHLLTDVRQTWLQARLRRVDDALDRLMSGSYGNCSKCGQAIDDKMLDDDAALSLCVKCWNGAQNYHPPAVSSCDEVILESLSAFDTILLRTHNSEYRIMLLDPKSGRALVEGGYYIVEPSEALIRGSSVTGDEFKAGTIRVGCRLEMWLNDRVFLTSAVESISVKNNGDAESVQNISAALH